MSELTNRVNLIGIKKVTETSKEKSFKKQESVGMMLAKVNKQDLEKERVTISKTKYPYISGFTKDMVLDVDKKVSLIMMEQLLILSG